MNLNQIYNDEKKKSKRYLQLHICFKGRPQRRMKHNGHPLLQLSVLLCAKASGGNTDIFEKVLTYKEFATNLHGATNKRITLKLILRKGKKAGNCRKQLKNLRIFASSPFLKESGKNQTTPHGIICIVVTLVIRIPFFILVKS